MAAFLSVAAQDWAWVAEDVEEDASQWVSALGAWLDMAEDGL